jgi:hypothetical protein
MSGETEQQPSGWTPDLLFLHLKTVIDAQGDNYLEQLEAMSRMLDERYSTQTKALDAAFAAQQVAMATAQSTAEKAVNAALQAAKEAVDKANTASEKRFEAVNEFRGQLSDVMSTMIPRTEAEQRFTALDKAIGEIKSVADKGFSTVEARSMGSRESRTEGYAERFEAHNDMTRIISLGAVLVSMAVLALGAIALLHH